MRYIADSNNYLQEVSFGADIECDGKACTEYTGAVPSGYSSLADWFTQEGDKLYRWKVVSGQLTLDSSVPVKSAPGEMFAPAGYGLGTISGKEVRDCNTATANGFYSLCGSGLQNAPPGLGYGNLLVINRYSNNHITQIAYYRNDMAIRTYYNSEWSTWEKFGTKKKLLWTNASPTSSFALQTIAVDLSPYNMVEVWFNSGAVIVKGAVGRTTAVYTNSTIYGQGAAVLRFREFSSEGNGSTGLTFSYAYSKATTATGWGAESSTELIPYRIYGIKGVG